LIINTIKSLNSGFTISSGLNLQPYIHVLDIARLYVLLVTDALNGGSPPEVWGEKAYYFAEGEEVSFKDFVEANVKVLKKKGILESEEIKKLEVNEIPDYWKGFLVIFFGADMRIRASRAKKLGWVAKEKGVIEGLGEVVGRWLESQK
jgi:nucleoside-diphosphate-sugar epimerase